MNQVKTILLLGGLTVLLLVVGGAISPTAFWFLAALAVAMNLGAYFFSDRIVLRMNRAHPVSEAQAPRLHRTVEELAREAGIPKPRVYLVDDPAPNAFATGRNREKAVVAVTSGILRILDERELRGVLAHELAHVKNRDVLVASVAAMLAAIIAMIASAVKWGAIFGFGRGGDRGGGNVLALLAMAIVAPIAATIIQLAISRSREYGADATGARISGDPLALASALSKLERGNRARHFHPVGDNPATASLFIVSPLSGERGLVKWFSTHPPVAERIRRLEELAGQRSPRARGGRAA